MRDRAAAYFQDLQDQICGVLETLDGAGRFREDLWERAGGGGGRTRVLAGGAIFEKGGVNFSNVFGELSEEFAAQVPGEGRQFTATGLSMVLHPQNPYVPTLHANFRFLSKGSKEWFGGGLDLTPYYPFREDVIQFHRNLRSTCERHAPIVDYRRMKEDCDRYFFLPHRGEARGVGGIFFDYLSEDCERVFRFVRDAGAAIVPAYCPIVERRKGTPFSDRERKFQLYRRGRYVEFNLLYDRGTLFGLKTGGRIESILMSLPPEARWDYGWHAEPGTPEAELSAEYLQPRDWAGEGE